MTDQSARSVLVVDDDPSTLAAVTSVLRESGFRTVAAERPSEALHVLADGCSRFDVVLTDVIMPGESGVDLLAMIHGLRPELPVILMTGYADLRVALDAIKGGVFDFVIKPINFSQLIFSIEKAAKHARLLELEKEYLQALERKVAEKTGELSEKVVELDRSRTELARNHEDLKLLFRRVQMIKQEWERTIDCVGDMLILADNGGCVKRCNRALRDFVGRPYQEIMGRNWRELFAERGLNLPEAGAGGTEIFHEATGRWLVFTSYPFLEGDGGQVSGTVINIHDATELKNAAEALGRAYRELQETHAQMLQREKMASVGQLAAGVAHEINNPIGFISSNLATLGKYVERLSEFIDAQAQALASLETAAVGEQLRELRRKLKLDYIVGDVKALIAESLSGAERVRKIVQDLKSFSRADEGESREADINECLESTLNIVWNELKYKATLHREYGEIPRARCYPQQLEQVFMNLLVNAAHAIEKRGEVTLSTRYEGGAVYVSVADTGCGIPEEKLGRIFEPFFTTKEAGVGTGLGLSISYDIVKKHNGEIMVQSEVGKGTTFTVRIPVGQGG
ncbi:MAG TPA: ATP-binding protein [Geobacteraceae bacterium]